jgi:hypothetical protein
MDKDISLEAVLEMRDHIRQLEQREWVGLTIQEVSECFGNVEECDIAEWQLRVYMEINAKLKGKNT